MTKTDVRLRSLCLTVTPGAIAEDRAGGRGSVALTTHIYGSASTTASGVALVVAVRVHIVNAVAMATPRQVRSTTDVLSWVSGSTLLREASQTASMVFVPVPHTDTEMVYYLFDLDLAVPEFVIEISPPIPRMYQPFLDGADVNASGEVSQIMTPVALQAETTQVCVSGIGMLHDIRFLFRARYWQ